MDYDTVQLMIRVTVIAFGMMLIFHVITKIQERKSFRAAFEWFDHLRISVSTGEGLSKDALDFNTAVLSCLIQQLASRRDVIRHCFAKFGMVYIAMPVEVSTKIINVEFLKGLELLQFNFNQIYGYTRQSTGFTSRSVATIEMCSHPEKHEGSITAVFTNLTHYEMKRMLVDAMAAGLLQAEKVYFLIEFQIITPHSVPYYDKLKKDLMP